MGNLNTFNDITSHRPGSLYEWVSKAVQAGYLVKQGYFM